MDEQTQQATRLWTLVQPVVSAFVTSVVRDFASRDDVLQDVAVAVIESFDRYDPERPFTAWTLGIAQNQVRLYLRRRQRERLVFDEELIAHLASAFEATTSERLRPLDFLKDCLGDLPGRVRELCDLRYAHDLKPATIAESVGMTANSVAKAMQRIRDQLRTCIAQKVALEGESLMALDPQTLIDGYLDETLSLEEHVAFTLWLQETPQHRQRFAAAVLLHDRLRGELLAMSAMTSQSGPAPSTLTSFRAHRRMGSAVALLGTVCTLAVVMAVLWRGFGGTPASAAVIELNRLIVANAQATDQTYLISVEAVAMPRKQREPSRPPDSGRPPKAPLDEAVLHVRGRDQFVLIRTTPDGHRFVTGSNGHTSWAVRPDGPVRMSSDLTRFNRDLPGHESAVPLNNIEEGLEQLRAAYDFQLLPIESGEFDAPSDDEPLRLLVAVKKKGSRGPRRVEITYAVETGQIRQMRFVEMPYGPERLTLRLTLAEERDLGAVFFDHDSHHDPERTVEKE